MATKVQVECISKKETKNWDVNRQKAWEIGFQVPYDQNSIYFQLSGGTGINLCTVNEDAAKEFEIGEQYEILISKVEKA